MHPWDREKVMWQVVVEIPGAERMIIGPFTDEQEQDALDVRKAWVEVATAAKQARPGFDMAVKYMRYFPALPNTDVGWLYSRYVQPALRRDGS